jgi:hypothetical protein
VGVRVHQTGQDHAAGGIQGQFVWGCGQQFFGRSDGKDLFVADEHRAILDNAEAAEIGPALRTAAEGQELGGRVD